ncbi:MAG: hypothetical protein C5B59_14045 [Bacteroidetes bacterium]|nr:MAG: hypothetical protein C5B59_14045 [Bacteroidota bacterium]
MSTLKFNPRNAVLLLIILLIAGFRVITNLSPELQPLAVVSPIAAMAIFGGAYFTGYSKPFVFPLLALFISDVVLSFTVFSSYRLGLLYAGWFWTYAAFALMTLAGKTLVKEVTVQRIALAVVATTLIHWLISDIGGCLMEKNAASILSVYGTRLVAAIPYELKFMTATAFYSAIMFGAFELLQKKFPSLRLA